VTYRPHMPLSVKLQAAILQLGLDPACVDFDHDPALGLRPFDKETNVYTPDANDPRFITVRDRKGDHRVKTSGNKATSAGSDIHRIAKSKRIAEKRAAAEEAEASRATGERVLTREKYGKRRWAGGRKMQSRPFLPPRTKGSTP
jgi:hypothetical protein